MRMPAQRRCGGGAAPSCDPAVSSRAFVGADPCVRPREGAIARGEAGRDARAPPSRGRRSSWWFSDSLT